MAYELHLFGRFSASQKVTEIGRNVFPVVHAISQICFTLYIVSTLSSLEHVGMQETHLYEESTRSSKSNLEVKARGVLFDGRKLGASGL